MNITATDLDVVEAELVPQATREEAEARRGRIRIALEVALEELLEAWRRRDAVALGYGTGPAGWRAYLEESYGDLRFALPAPQRQERVLELRREGLPVSAIKAIPGQGGTGTVARDLKTLREDGRLVDEHVDAFDGRNRQARQEPAPAPAPALGTVDAVVLAAEALIASGKTVTDAAGVVHELADGVTTLDLCARLKWRQGPASAAQSRAVKRRRLEWSGAWRDGFAVYRVARPALEQ